ncbi:CBS domain-containing protein [Litoreibacter albidus]|uniref:CBS domain-containing protein n=1 Tax=Litoreibacter albidus TaxID=670155 RepID=A0A1H2XH60_9RHOB|nr:CBS domain-containing protein [Litoreibacter albidus]SDW92028.1 CBS domain-containing protein [Litoreibacter albidus]
MLVSQILKLKADDGVVTIGPAASVADAANMLSTRKIGSVVVSSDNKTALGILSERDIVREIGKRGAGCLSETVDSMMTKKLVTCTSSDRADSILSQMTEGRFRHMPVVEGGEMIGLITLGDVVKARLSELSMEKDALEGMIMGH